jgi:hypothetical protein
MEIPDAARDLVLRAAWPVMNPSPEQVTSALQEAAALITATELRRLAATGCYRKSEARLLRKRAKYLMSQLA